MTFDEAAKQWGGRLSTAIPRQCWEEIEKRIKPGMRTLEFGSGLSTILFRDQSVMHTAIESDPEYVGDGATYIPVGDDGWYQDVPIRAFDLILLDGPRGAHNRYGFLGVVKELCHANTVIVIDDTHTTHGAEIAVRAAMLRALTPQFHTFPESQEECRSACASLQDHMIRLHGGDDRGFAIIESESPASPAGRPAFSGCPYCGEPRREKMDWRDRKSVV